MNTKKPLPHQTKEWEELSSHEKIKRVPIKPLPFKNGQHVDSGSKSSKVFSVRVSQQKPGVFDMDLENAVVITIAARGRLAAMEYLAEKIGVYGVFEENSKSTVGTTGRWYDGTMTKFEILETKVAAREG